MPAPLFTLSLSPLAATPLTPARFPKVGPHQAVLDPCGGPNAHGRPFEPGLSPHPASARPHEPYLATLANRHGVPFAAPLPPPPLPPSPRETAPPADGSDGSPGPAAGAAAAAKVETAAATSALTLGAAHYPRARGAPLSVALLHHHVPLFARCGRRHILIIAFLF